MVGIIMPGDKILCITIAHLYHILLCYLNHLTVGQLLLVLNGEVERYVSHRF